MTRGEPALRRSGFVKNPVRRGPGSARYSLVARSEPRLVHGQDWLDPANFELSRSCTTERPSNAEVRGSQLSTRVTCLASGKCANRLGDEGGGGSYAAFAEAAGK